MSEKNRHDHTLLIFFAAIFVFNSPLTNWWALIGLPWYAIFLVWAAFIVVAAINLNRDASDGH